MNLNKFNAKSKNINLHNNFYLLRFLLVVAR
jgi:hypothetical protein